MSERWAKLYEHAMHDAKLLAVAEEAGASRPVVSTVWGELIAYAGSHHPESGSIAGFNRAAVAAWCQVGVEVIERVLAAARRLGLLAGEALAAWARRQGAAVAAAAAAAPARSSGAERTRRWRSKRRDRAGQGELFEPVTASQASQGGVTPPVTGDVSSGFSPAPLFPESDKKKPPCSPPAGGTAAPMQISGRENPNRLVQCEILLPIAGRRYRRRDEVPLTRRQQRSRAYQEWIAGEIAAELARGGGADGRAA